LDKRALRLEGVDAIAGDGSTDDEALCLLSTSNVEVEVEVVEIEADEVLVDRLAAPERLVYENDNPSPADAFADRVVDELLTRCLYSSCNRHD
jgi:hypothetical protein